MIIFIIVKAEAYCGGGKTESYFSNKSRSWKAAQCYTTLLQRYFPDVIQLIVLLLWFLKSFREGVWINKAILMMMSYS